MEKLLSIDHPNIQIETNKIFKDSGNTVNERTKVFEVDIYSEDPLLICECTTFLKADEISKVEKLLKIKNYFENQTKQVKYIYFVTYDIDEKIKEKVEKFCNDNEICLIIKKSL